MKVIILDDWEHYFANSPILNKLKEHFEVEIYDDQPSKEQLIERLVKADVVIPIRERTKFTKDILQHMKHVKLIAQTGSGLAHIDVKEAEALNIPIATTPGGSKAVVELIFGFILAYSRKLVSLHEEMKKGIWSHSIGFGLENKTIGIIGLGKIGTGVATVAKAFNMKVLAWGPRLTEERAKEQGVEYSSLENLLQQSHYITLNVRLVPETKDLLTEEHFKLMRSDAFLINTSRGEVVNEEALIQALKDKKIGGAALDVFTHEPIAPDHPFLSLDNVLLSPHIGWKTDNMFNQFFSIAVDNIISRIVHEEV